MTKFVKKEQGLEYQISPNKNKESDVCEDRARASVYDGRVSSSVSVDDSVGIHIENGYLVDGDAKLQICNASMARPYLIKLDHIGFCVYNSKGSVVSAQCIYFNAKVKEVLHNSKKLRDGLLQIISERKALQGRRVKAIHCCNAAFTRVDPISGVAYNCRLLVEVD